MVQKFSLTCSRANGSFTSGCTSCPLRVGLTADQFWPVKCDQKRPPLLPCQSLNRQCPALQVVLPCCGQGGSAQRMDELRGPSRLQSQAGALEGSCCGKSVVSTGDFAQRGTKSFCCVKFLSLNLLPGSKLVHPGCSSSLQFPGQVQWGLTPAGMQSREIRNEGRVQLGWGKPQPF